jgi:chromosomal replication initiation ATPase DnaA
MATFHPFIKAAAKISKIKAADIANSRKKEPTAWRQVIMTVMRETGMSYAEIAAAVKRDHSTVYAACQKLHKIKAQQWFADMRTDLLANAADETEKRRKKEALDKFCENIPMCLYKLAWSSLE